MNAHCKEQRANPWSAEFLAKTSSRCAEREAARSASHPRRRVQTGAAVESDSGGRSRSPSPRSSARTRFGSQLSCGFGRLARARLVASEIHLIRGRLRSRCVDV